MTMKRREVRADWITQAIEVHAHAALQQKNGGT